MPPILGNDGLQTGAPIKPLPAPKLRALDDAPGTRGLIYGNVLTAANTIEPMTNQRHTLKLSNVAYNDPEEYSIADQKHAILAGKTLTRRLRGTWQLIDNATGNVMDEKTQTVARVPFLTNRGTFIHRGNEYVLINQMRLKPGIFTRRKDNGEIEAHVNVMPGKGVGHRQYLDPAKGVFYMKMGQARLPLLPLLRAMGATDARLKEAWGDQLLAANYKHDDPSTIKKLVAKLVERGGQDMDEMTQQQALLKAIEAMELDPEVTRRTLGQPIKNLNLDAILATSKKLLGVSRGEQDVDDRDAMAYQKVYGPEDIIAERLHKDAGGLRRQLLWKSSFRGNLSGILPGALDKQLESALLTSGLGQAAEEINPAEVLDKVTRITRLGEGGITSLDSIPDEARSVQPSHLNFLDPLRTPECYDEATEVFTKDGWKFWRDVTDVDLFACLINGRLEFHKARGLVASPYKGNMYGARTGLVNYLVTPNHRMHTRPYDYKSRNAPWRIETAEYMHDRNRRLLCGGFEPFSGEDVATFHVPKVEVRTPNNVNVDEIDFDDWAEFMGWWLAEGHCTFNEDGNDYKVGISQSKTANPENCRLIEDLLDRLPFTWHYNRHMKCYIINTRQLATYLHQFGFCYDKWIPEEFLNCHVSARQRMMQALLRGDGRDSRNQGINQFCSTSRRLALDFQRLAFSLGHSTRLAVEPENRAEHYLDNYVVHVHYYNERVVVHNSRAGSQYFVEDYSGMVYCAEVPGSLLHVRRNDSVGFWCGNSFRAGVDVFISSAARKGDDGRLYAPFLDARTNKPVFKSPEDVDELTVTFPQEMRRMTKRAWALKGGQIKIVPKSQIDLVVPHFEKAFSPLGNLVPLKSAVKGQRAVMAARMMTQALPLIEPEAPLVQSEIPDEPGMSYEEKFATNMGAIRADKPGRVMGLTHAHIKVQYDDGTKGLVDLYEHFPYNRKTFLHQTPSVRVGDTFKPGQLLARSNYTDDKGVTALGKNLKTLYIPFRGLNFEDAVVISESAAKKLASEHMYQHSLDWDDKHRKGKKHFLSIFPSKFDRKTMEILDDNGVVQPGTVVEYGQPLVLAAKQKEAAHNKLHRKNDPGWSDDTLVWKHHSPGIVTDVLDTDKGTQVLVKSTNPMMIGDKLSGRYGDKGVVADIIPDDQMPRGADGNPFELLLNPLGITTRTNPAQKIETALGRIAMMTGKPYRVSDFENIDDLEQFAEQELKKHGLDDITEDVIDPSTDRKIKAIASGSRFFMKLHHTAESKGQGRGTGGYTTAGEPAKGGEAGSKRLSIMDQNALLSHGALEVMRDAGAIRGQRNEDYWLAFLQGHTPPPPKVPMVYEKFVNELRASGINVVQDGPRLHVMALTDKDVDRLSGNREITSGDTVDWGRALEPIKGGLFDQALTGGHNGNRWAYVKLNEPMPNPVFEEPIRRVLGLTQSDFDDVIGGKKTIDTGTGPKAVQRALNRINVDSELEKCREAVRAGRKTARDLAVRKMGYLKSAQKLGIHPREWMLTKVPVLPPAFRPVSVMTGSKQPLVADANYLYKELIEANNNLKNMSTQVEDLSEERGALYEAFKAVTGLGDPVHPKLVEKNVKGILKAVFGSSPKFSTVQRRLMSSTTDLVGRAVVRPNPDLDMDHVGLPEDKAWDVYRNFIIRRLKRRGLPVTEAIRSVENRTDLAREELIGEMGERPVIINRAPVLHRWGIMAFYPRLVKEDTLQVSPLIVKGFGMDFDGDAVQYHVPVDDAAKKEAIERMLPSRNLLSAADFKSPWHQPRNEFLAGLYAATSGASKRRPRVFRNLQDAYAAFRRGEADINDPIELLE